MTSNEEAVCFLCAASHDDDASRVQRRDPRVILEELERRAHQELQELLRQRASQQQVLEAFAIARSRLEEERVNTKRQVGIVKTKIRACEGSKEAKLKRKRRQVLDLQERVDHVSKEVEELDAHHERTKASLGLQRQEWETQVRVIRESIYMLECEIKKGDVPPGPLSLRWLDSRMGHLVSCFVVIENAVVALLGIAAPDMLGLQLLRVLSIIAFQAELSLNLIFYQGMFLCGHLGRVWANWLDLMTVVVGTIACTGCIQDTSIQPIFQALLLARSLHAAWVLTGIMFSDLSWVEGTVFQTFLLASVTLNGAILGVKLEYPHLSVWQYWDNMVLCSFAFEMVCLLALHGWSFLLDHKHAIANRVDCVLTLMGVCLAWLAPLLLKAQRAMGMHADASFLEQAGKVFGITRLFRLIRLVRSVTPLRLLVHGTVRGIRGMMWVVVLTAALLYMSALLGRQILRISGVDGEAYEPFASISEAIFDLFMAMNADIGKFEPLLQQVPLSKYAMMLFIVVTNWSIFSILTAVVCKHVSQAAEEAEGEREAEERSKHKQSKIKYLGIIFQTLDVNGSGLIDAEQFFRLLRDDTESEQLCNELCKVSGMEKEELPQVWLIFSQNDISEGKYMTRSGFTKAFNGDCDNLATERVTMKILGRLRSIEHTCLQR
mmetsp:Transcript_862/g.2364  ORF Transcript_862/g.2364 Transcript_862/m.2364 type:complete len:662 (-) Transcript_862:108-2093(-)